MEELYKKHQALFDKYGITDSQEIIQYWQQPHRFYHTEEHLQDLIQKIEFLHQKSEINTEEQEILLMAAYFHDIVYDPIADDNEEQSAEFFIKNTANQPNSALIKQIILETKQHQATSKLSAIFCDLDMWVVKKGSFKDLLKWEQQIFKEFQVFDYSLYKIGRMSFLKDCIQKCPENKQNLENLLFYLETYIPNIGIYAGSFNPFHRGHLNILEKAEKVFDKIIIARGINPEKNKNNDHLPIHPILKYHQNENFEGMLTDYVSSKEANVNITLVRGLRNGDDLDYEVNQLRFMEDMKADLKVVFIRCDKQFEHISSSALRSLDKIGKGYSDKYIP